MCLTYDCVQVGLKTLIKVLNERTYLAVNPDVDDSWRRVGFIKHHGRYAVNDMSCKMDIGDVVTVHNGPWDNIFFL